MIIQPRIWGFLCTTAHPAGCAANVREAIAATRALGARGAGPRRALVIGASTGYGLAARIALAFGFGTATLGVFREKPARRGKTASAGWYHAAAFQREAAAAGLRALSVNADAFADATRERVARLIREQLGGPVDLVIHSLAAGARTLPGSGETLHTVLKPIGRTFRARTIDTDTDRLHELALEPATDREIADTVRVMGGEDWQLWIEALDAAGALAPDARTLAFSYLGPELTRPIYRDGTIGRAKAHLERTAQALAAARGDADFARVAVLKSIVTQASAALPGLPPYLAIVRRVLAQRGLDESAIEQQNRLLRSCLYPLEGTPRTPDAAGRWRLDDHELDAGVQADCAALWSRVTTANLFELTDYAGYKRAFLRLWGFGREDVDYAAECAPEVGIDLAGD